MAGGEAKRRSPLKEHAKELREEHVKLLRARFSDYEKSVTLISSVQSWFEHLWGPDGEKPGLLQSFDRFPKLDGATPDFLASFSTPYLLCGEHKRNFLAGQWGRERADQVLKYAKWQPPPVEGTIPRYDVMLLVGTTSDDIAAQQLKLAAGEGARAPIVILGFHLDEGVNGKWYILKWRSHDKTNSPFTHPNVNKDPNAKDLNKLIVEQPHCAIPVDESALEITDRAPLINDAPPEIYTFIRIVWPAINELLSEPERDELRVKGKIEKPVTCEQILGASILGPVKVPRDYVHKALDWFARLDCAKRLPGQEQGTYVLFLDEKLIRKKELLDFLAQRAARLAFPKGKAKTGGRRGKVKDARDQLLLGF